MRCLHGSGIMGKVSLDLNGRTRPFALDVVDDTLV